MQRSFGFPGWCAICRWTAVGAISVGTMAVLGAATSDHRPAQTVVRLAAQPEGSGLDWAGWTVRDPAEQRRSLDLLLTREKDRRAARAARAGAVATRTSAPASPSSVPIPPSALGRGTTLAAPQAVSVAIRYALAQVGKPYVWGATGPDSYDCSGLVQRSYAMAGVALPRTSREQARVGTAVDLPDLLPGDLLFWAYDPSDLSTVHHVAMYLGDGKIVQAPQPGEFVEVTMMWLSGYAGAVRVATGPATATLPPVPVGVPGSGITPIGDAMPDGSPPPSVAPPADPSPRSQTQSASSQNDAAPGTGSATPGTASPGTASPGGGSTSPGGTSSGTTAPDGTSSGVTSPGTTSPSSPGDSNSPSGTDEPSGTSSGTTAPVTSSAAPTTTSGPTSSAPTSSAPTSSAPTSSAPTSSAPTSSAPTSSAPTSTPPPPPPPPPPSTTEPPSPAGDASSDSAAPATTTSAPTSTSTTPANPTPTPS